jgi:nucleoside-diphosphate-sugar epimerase
MRKCLVTGAAGFIGSHLCQRLLQLGYEVIGIDCMSDYYPRTAKENNIEQMKRFRNFIFREGDLTVLELQPLLSGVDFIFHKAGQPGVRSSWGKNFNVYAENNILATQRLLESAKELPVSRFIFASSSSVYGDATDLPMREDGIPRPVSPYGVTKLAAEHLCSLYQKSFGLPVVSLRYFTVFGPRQRPDMAFHKFIQKISSGEEIQVYGDGEQTRDFTFVDDVIEANIALMKSDDANGRVFNIGGGMRITLNEAIKEIQDILDTKARVKYIPAQNGDMRHTYADISRAKELFGYSPRHKLREGLEAEIQWFGTADRAICVR